MEIKSLSEIAIGIISHIHDTLPEVDTKEGTFVRDVFIDPVSTQLANLYTELKLVELSQSILTSTGTDLDRLARNFFIRRKDATHASGKLRFYIGPVKPMNDIYLPLGSTVATPGDSSIESTEYITSASVDIVAADESTYSLDPTNGLYYVDVDATSAEPGSKYNVDTGVITVLGDAADTELISVTNPFPFTGGSDAENDMSLQMRVSMAISGVNIGTKDGYSSFMLKQSEVKDVMIVGAGDELMERDNKEGGMVDIYVRAENLEENIQLLNVDEAYVYGNGDKAAYENIELEKQPVLTVDKIIGRIPNDASEIGYDEKHYINASNYKQENGTNLYYRDVIWSSSIIPTEDLGEEELLQAEAINFINTQLNDFDYSKRLANIRYDIRWDLISDIDGEYVENNFYTRFYSDGLIYLITTKENLNNPYIGGRHFVKRNNVLYERAYVTPDFEVEKDTSHYSKSFKAKDTIRWLKENPDANLPITGETLYINYSSNSIIETLQERLDVKRILTADVLIKQATEVPVEIKIQVVPEYGYSKNSIKNMIIDNISSYINDINKMGGSLDRSDVVYLARGTDGVEAVNIVDIHLSLYDYGPEQKIQLSAIEYMKLESIYVEVLEAGDIV